MMVAVFSRVPGLYHGLKCSKGLSEFDEKPLVGNEISLNLYLLSVALSLIDDSQSGWLSILPLYLYRLFCCSD